VPLNSRFRLVQFQVNYALSQTNPRKIMRALDTLPRDLPEAYQEVFERIARQGDDRKEIVLKIVSWIFYAKRPLQMGELREAIAVELEDTELYRNYLLEPGFIVEISESLISYEKGSRIVGFSHFTVHEFMQSGNILLLSPADIAAVCLTCLSFKEFETPYFKVGSGQDSDFSQLGSVMRDSTGTKPRVCDFYRYAANFWGLHTKDAEEDEDIQKAVLTLLPSKNKRQWMRSLSWPISGYVSGPTTILHILVLHGLVRVAKFFLLLPTSRNDGYVFLDS